MAEALLFVLRFPLAYRFKAGEPVPDAVRRIASAEIDGATRQLTAQTNRDEAIHEARKSIKKLRGLLRLIQPELGGTYRAENLSLRHIGRKLSELRDARATVEIFDSLVEGHKNQLQKKAFASIRLSLEDSKQATERKLDVLKVLRSTVSALKATRKRVDDWPIQHSGFSAVAEGLRDRYRGGRRAMADVMQEPRPEIYHEWRKCVKDHWYHVRLLEDFWKQASPSRESDLHNLETWLGDDHNLVVLRLSIEANPSEFGKPETIEVFIGLLDERQKQLRQHALELGSRLYAVKPGDMMHQLEKLWKGRAKAASVA